MNIEIERKLLRRALERLVFKIDVERRKKIPLHPKGHPDCIWDTEYPSELNYARDVLAETRPDDGWPITW